MLYVFPVWDVVCPIILDQFTYILKVFFVQQVAIAFSHFYVEVVHLSLVPAIILLATIEVNEKTLGQICLLHLRIQGGARDALSPLGLISLIFMQFSAIFLTLLISTWALVRLLTEGAHPGFLHLFLIYKCWY